MTKKEMTEALTGVIINNSNLEADDGDSVMFPDVENVESGVDSIVVRFSNGRAFVIRVE